MATVIRVKRRIDEEPLSAFVLNSKKRRFEDIDADGDSEAVEQSAAAAANNGTATTVVKFAGTVESQDDIVGHIRKLTKADAIDAANHVRRPINLAARNRDAQRANAQESRFKIVNCFRTLGDDAEPEAATSDATAASATSTAADNLTVVDIEKSAVVEEASGASAVADTTATASAASTSQAAASQYVYDLYFPVPAANGAVANMDTFIEDLLSVEPMQELMHEADDAESVRNVDSDPDSNDEDNERNDYPDTEEEDDDEYHGYNGGDDEYGYGDENDDFREMSRAMGDMEFGHDLSDDDDDDDDEDNDYDADDYVDEDDADSKSSGSAPKVQACFLLASPPKAAAPQASTSDTASTTGKAIAPIAPAASSTNFVHHIKDPDTDSDEEAMIAID